MYVVHYVHVCDKDNRIHGWINGAFAKHVFVSQSLILSTDRRHYPAGDALYDTGKPRLSLTNQIDIFGGLALSKSLTGDHLLCYVV